MKVYITMTNTTEHQVQLGFESFNMDKLLQISTFASIKPGNILEDNAYITFKETYSDDNPIIVRVRLFYINAMSQGISELIARTSRQLAIKNTFTKYTNSSRNGQNRKKISLGYISNGSKYYINILEKNRKFGVCFNKYEIRALKETLDILYNESKRAYQSLYRNSKNKKSS